MPWIQGALDKWFEREEAINPTMWWKLDSLNYEMKYSQLTTHVHKCNICNGRRKIPPSVFPQCALQHKKIVCLSKFLICWEPWCLLPRGRLKNLPQKRPSTFVWTSLKYEGRMNRELSFSGLIILFTQRESCSKGMILLRRWLIPAKLCARLVEPLP